MGRRKLRDKQKKLPLKSNKSKGHSDETSLAKFKKWLESKGRLKQK